MILTLALAPNHCSDPQYIIAGYSTGTATCSYYCNM